MVRALAACTKNRESGRGLAGKGIRTQHNRSRGRVLVGSETEKEA